MCIYPSPGIKSSTHLFSDLNHCLHYFHRLLGCASIPFPRIQIHRSLNFQLTLADCAYIAFLRVELQSAYPIFISQEVRPSLLSHSNPALRLFMPIVACVSFPLVAIKSTTYPRFRLSACAPFPFLSFKCVTQASHFRSATCGCTPFLPHKLTAYSNSA